MHSLAHEALRLKASDGGPTLAAWAGSVVILGLMFAAGLAGAATWHRRARRNGQRISRVEAWAADKPLTRRQAGLEAAQAQDHAELEAVRDELELMKAAVVRGFARARAPLPPEWAAATAARPELKLVKGRGRTG